MIEPPCTSPPTTLRRIGEPFYAYYYTLSLACCLLDSCLDPAECPTSRSLVWYYRATLCLLVPA